MMIDLIQIKKLREATSLPLDVCKKALEKVDGDFDKAVEDLRKTGELRATKLNSNQTSEGQIFVYCHLNGRYGAMLELICQTDFAARSEVFQKCGQDLVMQLAGMPSVLYLSENEIPESERKKQKEIALGQLFSSGKKIPPEKADSILIGKMKAWYAEVCFLESKSLLTPSKTIDQLRLELSSQLGENVQIKRIVRWER